MISSIQTVTSALNGYGRGLNPGARNPENPETAETGAPRAVDKVQADASVGVELPQQNASQTAADQLEKTRTNALDENLAQKAIDSIAQKTEARSGIAVLKTADRMLGTLLDVVG